MCEFDWLLVLCLLLAHGQSMMSQNFLAADWSWYSEFFQIPIDNEVQCFMLIFKTGNAQIVDCLMLVP